MSTSPSPLQLTMASRLSIPDDVIVQDVAGESVLLDLKSERYYGLDEVGTTMLVALRDQGSVRAAYDTALSTYQVDGETLERDLLALCEELLRNGLLQIVE